MSDDPHRHRSFRSEDRRLPPLREVLGDALDSSPIPYRVNSEDANRALARPLHPHGWHTSPAESYPQPGLTLPPIRPFSSPRDISQSASSPSRLALRYDGDGVASGSSAIYTYPAITNPQPATGPSAYTFNVLRTTLHGHLVDVRTPSSQAQGILRPTAMIEDEDDSDKRYVCPEDGCNKRYNRPSTLAAHRATHGGEKPFPCQYPGCPRRFSVKSNMIRHFRTHPKPDNSQLSEVYEDDDSEDDEEESTDRWVTAESSSSRLFHTSSSSNRPSWPSSQAHISTRSSSTSSAFPNQYDSSSRRR